ncbi:PaaX family transcriptional regulator C-terminal domain-containing protein [Actinospongicola halichondriae]|uniref:PaaX family transcriptional regulator C-terminal domain-containing protein n=1 Tax=Actinospongicola halichondriae TaxID=3236844 RepID=UPI003D380D65
MSSTRDINRRPLTARSVIASTLLGVDPPRLPALALVRSGELFGLREGATRTALSRMLANGEVVAEDGHYALTGPLLVRHARQQSARNQTRRPWDGTWIAAVVTGERRSAADRSAFRTAATRLKLAEIREGVWMRPGELHADHDVDARAVMDDQATWLRDVRPDDPDALIRHFALDDWSERARATTAEMERWQDALDRRQIEALGETFVVAADAVRLLVADPDLPVEFLRPDWPGSRLRDTFLRFDSAFKDTWRAWHQSFQNP